MNTKLIRLMHIINLDASINQWAWNQSVVLSSIPTSYYSYFTLYTYCDISKFRSVSLLCILKFLVFGKIPSFWQTLVGIKSKYLGNNTRNLCQLLAYTRNLFLSFWGIRISLLMFRPLFYALISRNVVNFWTVFTDSKNISCKKEKKN